MEHAPLHLGSAFGASLPPLPSSCRSSLPSSCMGRCSCIYSCRFSTCDGFPPSSMKHVVPISVIVAYARGFPRKFEPGYSMPQPRPKAESCTKIQGSGQLFGFLIIDVA